MQLWEGEEGERMGLNPPLSQQEASRWCLELINQESALFRDLEVVARRLKQKCLRLALLLRTELG